MKVDFKKLGVQKYGVKERVSFAKDQAFESETMPVFLIRRNVVQALV